MVQQTNIRIRDEAWGCILASILGACFSLTLKCGNESHPRMHFSSETVKRGDAFENLGESTFHSCRVWELWSLIDTKLTAQLVGATLSSRLWQDCWQATIASPSPTGPWKPIRQTKWPAMSLNSLQRGQTTIDHWKAESFIDHQEMFFVSLVLFVLWSWNIQRRSDHASSQMTMDSGTEIQR